MSPEADVSRLVSSARQINIIVHRNPDGDSLGSALALKQAFPKKNIRLFCKSPIPSVFTAILGPIETAERLENADLIMVVDCSELHHTGYAQELPNATKSGSPLVVIDHHRQGNLVKLAAFNWCDSTASTTAELVSQLLGNMRIALNAEIATSLLLGLYTDTGGFQHPNTNSATLRLAGHLIGCGAKLQQITESVAGRRSLIQTKLWGYAMNTVEIDKKGLASARISRQTMKDLGAGAEDAAGLANLLCLTNEARASLVLVETDSGWRGTLRTRHKDMNMHELATLFNGKGTRRSAGFLATNELILGKILDEPV